MKTYYIIYSFILILLNSCGGCEDPTEPTLIVQLDSFQYYNHFYGIGGNDTLDMTYELPIAINSDTSIYLLINSLKIDTLGITYKRIIKYQSDLCGLSILLDSFKLLKMSTFDSADFIIEDYTNSILGDVNKNKYKIIIHN